MSKAARKLRRRADRPRCEECGRRMRQVEYHMFSHDGDGSRCEGVIYVCRRGHEWRFRCWGDGQALEDAKAWAIGKGGEMVRTT